MEKLNGYQYLILRRLANGPLSPLKLENSIINPEAHSRKYYLSALENSRIRHLIIKQNVRTYQITPDGVEVLIQFERKLEREIVKRELDTRVIIDA